MQIYNWAVGAWLEGWDYILKPMFEKVHSAPRRMRRWPIGKPS
jgi:hypothetical protein